MEITSKPYLSLYTAAQMLLLALVFYLKYEAPEEEQNFAMVMEMLRAGEVDEDDSKTPSALDNLFYDLRRTDPDHIAIKYYDAYHSGSGKTLKSIQITLASRLEKFNLESVAGLTITDELDLWRLGEEKTALFAIIPDNDTSFNFLVSLLYTQLFQQLFEVADKKYGGSLPVHVQFLMDEFAKVTLEAENYMVGALIDRFGKDIIIIPVDKSHFRTVVTVAVNTHFLGWVISLGGDVKIVGPDSVVGQMRNMIKQLNEQYDI